MVRLAGLPLVLTLTTSASVVPTASPPNSQHWIQKAALRAEIRDQKPSCDVIPPIARPIAAPTISSLTKPARDDRFRSLPSPAIRAIASPDKTPIGDAVLRPATSRNTRTS